MARKKVLTYAELMELARANYNRGGDAVYECWDERSFNEYVAEFGPMTKTQAMAMFRADDAYRKDFEKTAW